MRKENCLSAAGREKLSSRLRDCWKDPLYRIKMTSLITGRPRNPEVIKTTECKGCGTLVSSYLGKKKFCSSKCRKKYSFVNIPCSICHNGITIYRSTLFHSTSKIFTCSKECSAIQKKRSLLKFLKERKKSSLEKSLNEFLDRFFKNQWQYVGDGSLRIGGKNPDFIHVDKKILIEANGCFFHSCPLCKKVGIDPDKTADRILKYMTLGFKTIVIWEHELKGPNWEQKLIEKIEKTERCGVGV